MRDGRRVPLRQRLFVRLLVSSVLVAALSIAATAWLAVQVTTGAIRKEQVQTLAGDARVYNSLLGYAAAHNSWAGVEQTVRDLSKDSGRKITLASAQTRQPIASTEPPQSPPAPLPVDYSAIVDPLNVDTTLTPASALTGRIDPRAVGPFQLPQAEQDRLRTVASQAANCLIARGIDAEVVQLPGGRPKIVKPATGVTGQTRCGENELDKLTEPEQKALNGLQGLVDTCLKRQGLGEVVVNRDLTWSRPVPAPAVVSDVTTPLAATDDNQAAACVESSRREQLVPYVAPAALLFISTPEAPTTLGVDLSAGNTWRIAGVAAAVLLVTVLATVLVAGRLVRPVRALTRAADRMRDGDDSARVRARSGGEVGRLAEAFNEMSANRQQLEAQRKAMVSDVAHELRTPLSNIRGWLEASEDGVVDLDRALTSSLLEETLLLQHIIDDLRDLSAADAGRLTLHPEPLDVSHLLDQVAAAHHARAEAAGVTLSVHTFGDPELTADPVRLRQVIGNLLNNALRHTPPGGRVDLTADQQGDCVRISITDTGEGISAQDLPHIFDRFWRADGSRTRATGGSGLGLAIVRQLVEGHGGTVSAESTLGVGTRVTVRLPAA